MKKHEHIWNYGPSTYSVSGNPDKCMVRRWCTECGLIQHSLTTGEWCESPVGEDKLFDNYPDGYEPPEDI